MTPDRIPALEQAARDLLEATQNLAISVGAVNAKVDQARKETRHARFASYAVLVLVAGQLVIDVLFLGAFLHRNDAVNAIRDCTTPTGQCYQRSQQNQKQILALLHRDDLAVAGVASLCARDPANSTLPAMLACMERASK